LSTPGTRAAKPGRGPAYARLAMAPGSKHLARGMPKRWGWPRPYHADICPEVYLVLGARGRPTRLAAVSGRASLQPTEPGVYGLPQGKVCSPERLTSRHASWVQTRLPRSVLTAFGFRNPPK